MLNFLKPLPIQLLLSIALAFVLGSYVDYSFVVGFYTLSSCLIEILMFILPLMVFAFIFTAINKIQANSIHLILFIFLGATISNLISLSIAYSFSLSVLPSLDLNVLPDFAAKLNSTVEPFFRLGLPKILSTGTSMLLAVVLGIAFSFVPNENVIKIKTQSVVQYLTYGITVFLQKVFIPLLPIYVFGFCLKLSYDQALVYLFQSYGKVFLSITGLIWIYVPLLYIFASRGDMRAAWGNIKKMLPAGLTGFSTMSSAATMPVTLKCTQDTTKDPAFADLIIPTTANIHMLGDNLTLTVTSMALLTIFGMPLPEFGTFILFACAFCLAALSCVGIPGATVIIILPVLQNFLDFTPEMLSAITTIYVLQDPFGTTANVIGNGGFALFMQRLFRRQPIPNTAVVE